MRKGKGLIIESALMDILLKETEGPPSCLYIHTKSDMYSRLIIASHVSFSAEPPESEGIWRTTPLSVDRVQES